MVSTAATWSARASTSSGSAVRAASPTTSGSEPAREQTTGVPEAIASLGKRVMGYYGVIDERLDYELLAKLAAAFPDVALVMIGPAVKVDPRELPKAPTIHWLGQRKYEELPAHLKGFDVALMPFALNEATEFINPTKTLEYMAAAKPVVSTAVSDVLHHFADAAEVGMSHDDFIAAVGRALQKPDPERIARLELMLGLCSERLNDATTASVHFLAAQPALPQLADYVAYHAARALWLAHKTTEATQLAQTVARDQSHRCGIHLSSHIPADACDDRSLFALRPAHGRFGPSSAPRWGHWPRTGGESGVCGRLGQRAHHRRACGQGRR